VVDKFIPVRPPPNCELLTAVRHSNGTDFWLIGHVYGTDEFFVYAITEDGLADEPLLQAIGPVIDTPQPGTPDGSNFDAIGNLKASPQGDRLAFTTFYNGRTALFDFDASTGLISNPIPLLIGKGGYGVCFSPGGSKLYVSARDTAFYSGFIDADLFQFDLSAGDAAAIQASRFPVFSPALGGFATMRLGPDQRIYVARASQDLSPLGDSYLGVIVRPELQGAACNYVHDGVFLNGQRGSWSLNSLYETGGTCGNDLPTGINPGLSHVSLTWIPTPGGMDVIWPDGLDLYRMDLLNSDGRVLRLVDLRTYSGRADLSTRGLAAGCYIVRVSGPGTQWTDRFVISDQ
jgi:hypothetical protein